MMLSYLGVSFLYLEYCLQLQHGVKSLDILNLLCAAQTALGFIPIL